MFYQKLMKALYFFITEKLIFMKPYVFFIKKKINNKKALLVNTRRALNKIYILLSK